MYFFFFFFFFFLVEGLILSKCWNRFFFFFGVTFLFCEEFYGFHWVLFLLFILSRQCLEIRKRLHGPSICVCVAITLAWVAVVIIVTCCCLSVWTLCAFIFPCEIVMAHPTALGGILLAWPLFVCFFLSSVFLLNTLAFVCIPFCLLTLFYLIFLLAFHWQWWRCVICCVGHDSLQQSFRRNF